MISEQEKQYLADKIDEIMNKRIHKILEEEIPEIVKNEVSKQLGSKLRELARIS